MPTTNIDDASGILRLVVPVGDREVIAFLSADACRAHDDWRDGAADALGEFYRGHRREIDAVVRRRAASCGARHPVVVRAQDL
jgi:hypothetical protein